MTPAAGAAASALPGLARIAAAVTWHTTVWGARAYARAGVRVAKAVVDADARADLTRDAAGAVGVVADVARTLLPGAPSLPTQAPDQGPESAGHRGLAAPAGDTPAALRRRGAALLERSRDVWSEEQGHPAYARILDELAPDEARILLLLLQSGPQPSVDVRGGGLVGSQLVAPGLSMLGSRAGVRYADRVPAYLNNLFRLGLVWFSKEALRDSLEYQVLEAQPDVLEAQHSVKFAKVVRRSIHLTPFGEGFCRTTLVDPDAASAAFPEHAAPESGETAEPPTTAG